MEQRMLEAIASLTPGMPTECSIQEIKTYWEQRGKLMKNTQVGLYLASLCRRGVVQKRVVSDGFALFYLKR